MTPRESADSLSLVFKLWPKCAEDWVTEQQQEFLRRTAHIRIDGDQARAAILNLSMKSKYKSVRPAEVMEALNNAVAREAEAAKDTASHGLKRTKALATDVLLHRLPDHLRHEALLRIDTILPPKATRNNLGCNLSHAAMRAENGEWSDALEWPLFRFEVKECPAVRAWLSQQELPALDLATFANVSCNPY